MQQLADFGPHQNTPAGAPSWPQPLLTPPRRSTPAHGDAIRIVPLHLPASPATPTVDLALAAPAVAPQLTYRNGPLIAAPEVLVTLVPPPTLIAALEGEPALIP